MQTTIPDLWSDDIRVDVLRPLVILRSQESLLARKTQGILEAKVSTVTNDVWELHQLDLIAPALNHYRTTLLTAKHARDMVYPVTVRANCFLPKTKSAAEALVPGLGETVRVLRGEPPGDQREAATQEEFIDLVRQVLRSGEVRALIQSLVARSNEIRLSDPSTDQSMPEADSSPPGPIARDNTDQD